MKPPGHAVISLGIGGILWAITKSPYAMLAGFLTGVMIDLDHLVEYYRWFVKEDNTRIYYFLHSYELAIPAFLGGYFSGWDPVVLGISCAFLGHVLTDQLVNPMVPLAYFFTYRALKGFRRREIVDMEWDHLSEEFLRMPISRQILAILNPRIKSKK